MISRGAFDAVIFDLDGVITQSAKVHAQAWKEMFDAYLIERGKKEKKHYDPFDIQKDYLTYVDGKPRLDGIKSFLQSRNIHLPEGSIDDTPEKESVYTLGTRKNIIFLKYLKEKGIDVYHTSVEFVHALLDSGFKVAIVSSSKNCSEILETAGITDLFAVQVDGIKSMKLKLKGKPAPDIFLQAAKELGIEPKRAVVIEDSLAGVQAAKQGHFGCVIGIDRANQTEELKKNGADHVVTDLAEVKIEA